MISRVRFRTSSSRNSGPQWPSGTCSFSKGKRWTRQLSAISLRRFGKLHVHPVYPHVDGVPEITSIETRPDDLPDNDNWHTDVTFIETPPFGAILTPRILPSSGGDTLWGSNVAAYQALSAPIRSLLDGLTAEHSFETGFPRRRWGVGARKEKWEKAVAANPPVVHPVVRTIEDGRRGLFVNSGFTSRILELTEKESDALLAFLFAHLAKPEFTVRWRWKLGDVAFWDNRLSTHYATLDYLPEARVMHRAAILGDRASLGPLPLRRSSPAALAPNN